MKRLIFTTIIVLALTGVFAYPIPANAAKPMADTVIIKKGKTIRIGFGKDAAEFNINKDRKDADSIKRESTYPKFSFGLTLSRLDLGLATLVDNGSFTLSAQNQFLRYRSWKTSNAGFDVIQLGVRFSN